MDDKTERARRLMAPQEILALHSLVEIRCDHEAGRDLPVCNCAVADLGWHDTVQAAKLAWARHVLGALSMGYDGLLAWQKESADALAAELAAAEKRYKDRAEEAEHLRVDLIRVEKERDEWKDWHANSRRTKQLRERAVAAEKRNGERGALIEDLIRYSGLREKVRLRTDSTEYAEAESLIARADALAASGSGELKEEHES